MKVTFLGTRAYIDAANPLHRRHSALLLANGGGRVLVDCGLDWAEALPGLHPEAVVLTHAHADHSGGLASGAPCPVYATAATWEAIADYPLAERETVEPRRPFSLCGMLFEAFALRHSLRAPAVGYRIRAGETSLFYAPDLAAIDERREALAGVDLYIGDGSALHDGLLRVEEETLCGHAPVATQLGWCAREGVQRVLFTHCGEAIVPGEEAVLAEEVAAEALQRGVLAIFAHDGMEIELH
ncbi:MBL fold metallo-hydrolase [uncultured Desulfuromonas sp.]|uniref:MBL fold metallo-hydrolase n=1 Tax=uncultured Desulfuromonas sp. TaxID=181013 RepID=UPI002617C5D8|nr:MBL fold metallo-hydrolase [uncultured Desulfuromonas sp.]